MSSAVDLRRGEEAFGIPPVPVWPETTIITPGEHAASVPTLAAFHGPGCGCGRPFGICYDLEAINRAGGDPNVTLLHELTHAWQYHIDPEHSQQRQMMELDVYGYWDAPHEREARMVADALDAAGIRVWFPERL